MAAARGPASRGRPFIFQLPAMMMGRIGGIIRARRPRRRGPAARCARAPVAPARGSAPGASASSPRVASGRVASGRDATRRSHGRQLRQLVTCARAPRSPRTADGDARTARDRFASSAFTTRLRWPCSWRVTSRDSSSRTLADAPIRRSRVSTPSMLFQVTTPRPRRMRHEAGAARSRRPAPPAPARPRAPRRAPGACGPRRGSASRAPGTRPRSHASAAVVGRERPSRRRAPAASSQAHREACHDRRARPSLGRLAETRPASADRQQARAGSMAASSARSAVDQIAVRPSRRRPAGRPAGHAAQATVTAWAPAAPGARRGCAGAPPPASVDRGGARSRRRPRRASRAAARPCAGITSIAHRRSGIVGRLTRPRSCRWRGPRRPGRRPRARAARPGARRACSPRSRRAASRRCRRTRAAPGVASRARADARHQQARQEARVEAARTQHDEVGRARSPPPRRRSPRTSSGVIQTRRMPRERMIGDWPSSCVPSPSSAWSVSGSGATGTTWPRTASTRLDWRTPSSKSPAMSESAAISRLPNACPPSPWLASVRRREAVLEQAASWPAPHRRARRCSCGCRPSARCPAPRAACPTSRRHRRP